MLIEIDDKCLVKQLLTQRPDLIIVKTANKYEKTELINLLSNAGGMVIALERKGDIP